MPPPLSQLGRHSFPRGQRKRERERRKEDGEGKQNGNVSFHFMRGPDAYAR